METSLGSPNYVAPEVLFGEYSGTGADVWSLDTVFYYMFSGELPFDSTEGTFIDRLVRSHMAEQAVFQNEEHSAAHTLALLRAILQQKSEDRLTLAQIRAHPAMQLPLKHTQDDQVAQQKLTISSNSVAADARSPDLARRPAAADLSARSPIPRSPSPEIHLRTPPQIRYESPIRMRPQMRRPIHSRRQPLTRRQPHSAKAHAAAIAHRQGSGENSTRMGKGMQARIDTTTHATTGAQPCSSSSSSSSSSGDLRPVCSPMRRRALSRPSVERSSSAMLSMRQVSTRRRADTCTTTPLPLTPSPQQQHRHGSRLHHRSVHNTSVRVRAGSLRTRPRSGEHSEQAQAALAQRPPTLPRSSSFESLLSPSLGSRLHLVFDLRFYTPTVQSLSSSSVASAGNVSMPRQPQ
jgi:serine/threonine protein kinase